MNDLLISKNTLAKINCIIEKPAHAYILFGPKHLGKKTTAYHLAAKLVHGESAQLTDKQISKFTSANVTVIYPESSSHGVIKIHQIKKIIEEISLTSLSRNTRRVIILNHADRLSKEAANSLLKSLEEPNDRVVFILTTDNLSKVMPTIISRCQLINFNLPTKSQIENYLNDRLKLNIKDTDELIRLSERRVGLIKKYLGDKKILSKKLNLFKLAEQLASSNVTNRFGIIHEVVEKNQSYDLVNELILVYRDRILDDPNASANLGKLIVCEKQLANNLNPRLVLENLSLNLV